ncbi:ribbon-helix-helix protein, CopG family [Fusobacterium ulcerans]|jgi:hypothetical protein|uniref:Ribbon-helix-helix protein CopG domain-containing protein n=1 Tax=Fusobacterium ulcerans 12-1B TaxID=457404 RepID=H1PVU9_9FUSO|nr:ribbon-helix-helix protein, CopG family [Fusobacterium ulcerans]EHO79803.1 hypothetical protein HMPREF0402_02542 [Fusobacterium ulcerans 12-1B]
MENDLKRTQIYISEAKLKKLKSMAFEKEITVSKIIRNLIDEFLEKEEK